MSLADYTTAAAQADLNNYLASRSYLIGYVPTKADAKVFESLGGKAPGDNLPHLQRWFRHIASFDAVEKTDWVEAAVPSLSSGTGADKKSPAKAAAADDDDDVDLFGSDDEEDAEAAKIREERLAAYAAKKSKKPALIAKSSVLLDVKPWDDETDMAEVERQVRSVEMDGLLWGASKLMAVGYGIKKLQIMCVIEDEKVSIDLLTEKIQEFEDNVQSVDIAAFNKI